MFSPCSELGIFMYGTCNSMSNLLSYCGLIDAKIRASDKDLPVYPNTFRKIQDQSRSLNLRKNSDISTFWLLCVYIIVVIKVAWIKRKIRSLGIIQLNYLCLVLLQVPKCFGLVQMFCARPKIYLDNGYCGSRKHFVPDKKMICIQ